MSPGKKRRIKKAVLIPTYSFIMLVKTFGDFFRRVQRLPSEPIVIRPNEIKIWMVGHATVLINFFGITILTDPVLVKSLPIPKRRMMPGYNAGQLPLLDFIIISHAHFDHFDRRTLRQLAKKTKTIIVPKNCSDLIKRMPFENVTELGWGKVMNDEKLTVTSYRAEHWGRRVPWERVSRGYNCYTIERNGRTIFFGGDTAYGPHFKVIGEKHKIDMALLPISAYKPMGMGLHHMNPLEAHDAFSDLRSRHCIPIHWGSFRLTLERMDEPPRLFKNRAMKDGTLDRTHILPNGQSYCLNLLETKICQNPNT
mgnify:CR=1 FL=1